MSNSKSDFTVKFFRPPQRTVSCHNGLLDTRTKRTIARDRLLVAEQRILDVERRKSASNLQSIAFEQKQLEKRLSSLHSLDHSLQMRHRSTSEVNLHRLTTWNDSSPVNHSKLLNSTQNLLSIPKTDQFQQAVSIYSSEDLSESGEEDNNSKILQPPTVLIIPPEEDT